MRIGIAVFAYNRNEHLLKTLDGLRKNKEVKEIYVFQDGLKKEEHRIGWEATKAVIASIGWCKVNYILSDTNKGLAKSLVYGINYVLNQNEAIIVLEDDCVPSSNFINFMIQCFEKYNDNKKVFSVSGYSWPMDMGKDDYDIYFTGRISSWGWGTWKDRWKVYEQDNQILDRIINDKGKSVELAMWGNDLEDQFKARIAGKNDSWAVYWALKVIELQGRCVVPYDSLIKNIGCDGSGVHCGTTNKYDVELDGKPKDKFLLPDCVEPVKEAVLSFASLHGSYTATNNDKSKEKVIVYGLGKYFKRNEMYINQSYYIEAFVDAFKEGYYAGKDIIKMTQINTYEYDAIVIMMMDIQECLNVAKKLRCDYNVPMDKIRICGARYESWF